MVTYEGLGPGRSVKIIDRGRIELTCTHQIDNVTPEMILWFFTHRTKERYGMWHKAHEDFKTIREAGEGFVGSIYYIKERFANGAALETKLLVVKASLDEFAEKHLSWKSPGAISHRMERTPKGTRVHSRATFGSTVPVVGPLINCFLRRFVHTVEACKGVFNHMDEEFGNFPKFLPDLYVKCKKGAGSERL